MPARARSHIAEWELRERLDRFAVISLLVETCESAEKAYSKSHLVECIKGQARTCYDPALAERVIRLLWPQL